MRKLVILFLIISALWCLLSGCGGGGATPPTPTPTPANTYSISVNAYDKSTGQALPGVSLSIVETGQNINLNNGSYQTNLNSGQYTIYLSKSGYIAKGYIFNLTAATVINAYLNQVNSIENYGTVSGSVLDSGNNYSGSFDVCTANQTTVNDTPNITSPFSNITSVCGNIAVSVYTTTSNGIAQIVYLKTSLSSGGSQTGLGLTLPASPLNYSGAKPAGDTLVVKQSDGDILASQTTANTSYSFGMALLSGDSLTLESSLSQAVSNASYCYFTRVAAGSSGGTFNLQYQTAVPGFTEKTNNSSYYEIDFNQVNFASYYEVYAIQITGSDSQVPIEVIGLSGTSVKVPRNLLASGADTTLICVRAVDLPGFNITTILNGNQGYQNYSYTENDQTLTLGSSLLRALNFNQNLKALITRTKTKYHLNYLCTE